MHINRIVPFLFDPKRKDTQKVTLQDVDEFHIEMILSHNGRLTNKRNLEFKVIWSGFDETFDTWELCKNLRNVDKLHDYLSLVGLNKEISNEHQK